MSDNNVGRIAIIFAIIVWLALGCQCSFRWHSEPSNALSEAALGGTETNTEGAEDHG